MYFEIFNWGKSGSVKGTITIFKRNLSIHHLQLFFLYSFLRESDGKQKMTLIECKKLYRKQKIFPIGRKFGRIFKAQRCFFLVGAWPDDYYPNTHYSVRSSTMDRKTANLKAFLIFTIVNHNLIATDRERF